MDRLVKIEQLKQMAEADPVDPVTFFMLGSEQLHVGQFEGAIASFRRCIELAPDNTPAFRLLGDAYRKAGQPEEARRTYQQAIDVAEWTGDLQVAREARALLQKMEKEGAS